MRYINPKIVNKLAVFQVISKKAKSGLNISLKKLPIL